MSRSAPADLEMSSGPSSPSAVRNVNDASDGMKGKASVVVENAEFVVTPKTFKAWAIQQLLGINLANIALLITVIAVSANINSQLDEQRAYGIQSQIQIERLNAIIAPATVVAAQLQAKSDLVVAYNATLDRALQLGFTNLTGQLSDLSTTVSDRGFVWTRALIVPPPQPGCTPTSCYFALAAADGIWSMNPALHEFVAPSFGTYHLLGSSRVARLAAVGGASQMRLAIAAFGGDGSTFVELGSVSFETFPNTNHDHPTPFHWIGQLQEGDRVRVEVLLGGCGSDCSLTFSQDTAGRSTFHAVRIK